MKRVNSVKEVKMKIKINGRDVEAVLDTGSQHNLIKPETVHQMELNMGVRPTPPLVTAVGGDVKVEGVAVADVTMEGNTTSAEFFVISELTDEVILGLDTLGELGVMIECREGIVKTRRVSDDMREVPDSVQH